MTDVAGPPRRRIPPGIPTAVLVFIPLIGLTIGAAYATDRLVDDLYEQRFTSYADTVERSFTGTLADRADELYALRALFDAADGNISREGFAAYLADSGFHDQFAAATSAGYIRVVPRDELGAFEERVRAEGWTDFRVHPAGERDTYYVLDYRSGSNATASAFGFDLGSDPERLATLQRAARTNVPAATGPIVSRGDPPHERSFLLVLPVYAGRPPDDPERRVAATAGFVESAHRAGELMAAVRQALPNEGANLDVEIYGVRPGEETSTLDAGTLLYDSDDDMRAATVGDATSARRTSVDLYGARWVMVLSAPPDLLSPWERADPSLVLVAGSILSASVAAATHFAAASHQRAEGLAARMVDSARRDEQRFRALVESAPDAMLILDEIGRVKLVNHEAMTLLGLTREDIVGTAIGTMISYPDGTTGGAAERRLLSGGARAGIDLVVRHDDGSAAPIEVNLNPMATSEGIVFVISARDATQRKQRESEAALARELAVHISGSPSFDSALKAAVETVCTATRWTLGQVWVPSPEGDRLICHPIWHVNRPGWRDFHENCAQTSFARGEDVLGRAWENAEQPNTKDLAGTASPHGAAARAAGFASWLVIPIEAGHSVVAVIEFFSTEPTSSDTHHSDAVRGIGPQLGALYLRKRAEDALRSSEERFRGLLETAPDAMVIVDASGLIILVNAQTERLFGYTRDQILGSPVERLIPSRFREIHSRHREGYYHEPRVRRMGAGSELYGLRSDGTEFPVEVSLSPLRTESGLVVSATIRDMTERVAAGARLRASLDEKESLLKEVHHRVKNNLQVISGLLALQSDNVSDEKTREMLVESRDRVKSMALVHEKLYESSDLSRVELGSYVEELCHDLHHAHGGDRHHIALRADVEPVHVDLDTAVACGLIMNELVSNAFKHGFPNDAAGTITVRVRERDGTVTMDVSDDGIGFEAPVEGAPTKTMGLRLVTALVRQLHGTLKSDGSNGARFHITFSPERKVET